VNDEEINLNPSFAVWLIDIGNAQDNIIRTELGQKVKFRINEENRVEGYTLSSRYLGIVAKKDTVGFESIYDMPSYFEGEVIAIARASKSSYKLKVSIKVKKDCSFRFFLHDENSLNSLVVLEECFKENENIICNYGKVKILKVHQEHLEVEVPQLGIRNVYDLKGIERYHD